MLIKQSIFNKISILLFIFAILSGCEDVIKPIQDFKPNQYPSIISFTSDLPDGTELYPNLPVTLTVEAYDPEGEPLNFVYDSEDGSFSGQTDENDTSIVTFYTAGYLMSAQTVSVSVTVTDNKGFSVSQQLQLGDTREGPTVTVIGDIAQYITSDSQTEVTFSANQSGLYEVLVFDNTGATAVWDDAEASYFYPAGDEVTISIDGPSWAGLSGNAQLTNPPDMIAVLLKDSLESVGTYSFILDVDDDSPVSSVDVPGTSSLNPIPVTITANDAKSGVAAISYTIDGSTPDFSGNGTVVSGNTANITVGTAGVGSYTLNYRAIDNLDNIEATNTETYIIQADITAPGPVTDLIATQAGGGQISLSYTEPADPDLDHILITWVPDGATGYSAAAGSGSADITGFTNGTTYTLTVIAVDTSYNESTGSTVTITPPDNLIPIHYIYTSADLNAVRGGVTDYDTWAADDYYILMTNINLNGYDAGDGFGWMPVPNFSGTFDGNSFTITNLTINRGTTDYTGLFAIITNAAAVMNLTIDVCSVTGSDNAGGLAGRNSGTLASCHITGTSSVSGNQYSGGLIGYNDGAISHCHSTADVVNTTNYAGGLIGLNLSGDISNSYSTGAVTGGNAYNGGLIGFHRDAAVSNCYATGIVTSDGSYNGGLIGYNEGTGSGAPVTDCYATGNVIANAYNVGNNGGLIGHNLTNADITNCYAEGNLSYNDETGPYHGGLVGRCIDSDITGCYASGNVDSQNWGSSNTYNGGLVGSFEGTASVISNSYATGDVDGSMGNYNGALAGMSEGIISECFSTGGVQGNAQNGGIAGNNSGNIQDCYTISLLSNSIHGDSSVGGLVGYNTGSIDNCYSVRDLASAGGTTYGGLVGNVGTGGTATESFYDEDVCGYMADSGWTESGTPTPTGDMQSDTTFISAGWDFTNIWSIGSGINNDYPYLLNTN